VLIYNTYFDQISNLKNPFNHFDPAFPLLAFAISEICFALSSTEGYWV